MTNYSLAPRLEVVFLFDMERALLMHIWELQLIHGDQTLFPGDNNDQLCS